MLSIILYLQQSKEDLGIVVILDGYRELIFRLEKMMNVEIFRHLSVTARMLIGMRGKIVNNNRD